ncbi:MAG TPA: sigma factor [Nonomuraea sp.]|nr:sigma factor [Nonomuraea sp.]
MLHPDDLRVFTAFVTTRSDSLIRLAYVLTGDQHAAEDLLQSALARTADRWRSIRGDPEAYVRRVMYHEQVGRWRSPRWGRERVVEAPPERIASDDTA